MAAGYEFSSRSDEKVLNLENGEVTQVCEYTKSHWIVLFKNVECFVNYISYIDF